MAWKRRSRRTRRTTTNRAYPLKLTGSSGAWKAKLTGRKTPLTDRTLKGLRAKCVKANSAAGAWFDAANKARQSRK